MGFIARVKKLTSYVYSPTNPASEDAIRTQVDDSIQEVYNNVQSGLAATDGASLVGYSGSYATVEVALQAFESGGSGTIPPDGSITNGKLAADVKVGSLALLDTTAKNDVVSAINEVNTNADTNSTNISNLQNTIDYSTTVSGTDALTITTVNGGFTFAVGKSVRGIAVNNNTTSMTANIDADGALPIKKLDGSSYVDVEADDFEDNKPFELICQTDGVIGDFFLLAPKGGSNIKSIQSGEYSLTSSSGTVSISPVDLNKSIIIIKYKPTASTTAAQTNVRASFSDDSTILFNLGSYSTQIDISYQVIEFNNVKNIQSGLLSLNTSRTLTTVDTTISEVDLTKCIFVSSFFTTHTNAGTASGAYFPNIFLLNSTTIRMTQDNANYARYVSYYAIEFK